jgi:hypothetical protein
MAVWLNMKGKEASLCASIKDGKQKLQATIAKRSGQGARITPLNIAPALDVHYIVTCKDFETEEYWLSDKPESRRDD